MIPENGKLTRSQEISLLADAAAQAARLELEKMQVHIGDMLKEGDVALPMNYTRLVKMLGDIREWILAYEMYWVEETPVTFPVPHPIPDHEDDRKEGERL